jgi:hypothetical protein
MRYVDLPAKVLSGSVSAITGLGAWPYDDGTGDPFWVGGSTPKDYRWRMTMTVVNQQHSSYKTRRPYYYTGMDVSVGDYVADREEGICVKVTAVISKTDTSVVCEVEDVLRYNTFRFQGGTGVGIFRIPSEVIVFSLNEEGLPVVDPVPTVGVGPNFFPNVMSRFQNIEADANFPLAKDNHGFEQNDLISADPNNNTFVKTDSGHPYIVGTVSFNGAGPNTFFINPIQKVLDNMDSLIGDVGEVIYADPNVAGGYSTVGTVPVMIKLRNNTQSQTVGSVFGPTSPAGTAFKLNGVLVTMSAGTLTECQSLINNTTATHGIVASTISSPVVAQSNPADCVNGEPAFLSTGAQATINGVLVTFNTTTVGQATYGSAYALEEDMATDINAANIPNVVATTAGNKLVLTNSAGGSITIVNVAADTGGNQFAGPASASGVPLATTSGAGGSALKLTAPDARAIDIYDQTGTFSEDFGIVSAENGTKAAALYIEQGIREASTYVVANIPARDALDATFGDQCFVQDAGNGEWAHYIRTLDNSWVKLSDADSSVTDAQSVEIEVEFNSATNGLIHTISSGRRVSFVTVTVVTPFNGTAPTIAVGDAGSNSRLMTADQNDLTTIADYSTTPSYTYSNSGSDTDIEYYFDPGNSTSGKAVIAITYT